MSEKNALVVATANKEDSEIKDKCPDDNCEDIDKLRKKIKQCKIEKKAIHLYYEQVIESKDKIIKALNNCNKEWIPDFNFDEMNLKKQIETEKLENEKLKEEIKRLNEDIYDLVNNNTEIQQLMEERKQLKHENNELHEKVKLLEEQLKRDDEPLLNGREKNEFPFKKGIIELMKTNEKIDFNNEQDKRSQFVSFDDIKFEEIDYDDKDELENQGFQQINEDDNDLGVFTCEEEIFEHDKNKN